MSYLFDSSSIFRSISEDRVQLLVGNYTTELAKYELGNIMWKEHTIKARMDAEKMIRMISLIKRILSTMSILLLDCREEEVARIAKNLRISFYDASYVFHAKERSVPMVTEDDLLIKRVERYTKALKLHQALPSV